MEDRIRQLLLSIRRRQRLQCAIDWMGTGALIGGVALLILAITVAALGVEVSVTFLMALLFIPTTVTFTAGFIKDATWKEAAEAVDLRYRFKNRTVTALEFSQLSASPARQLQVDDAIAHLQCVDSRLVVPLSPSPQLTWAAGCLLAAGAVCLWPARTPARATLAEVLIPTSEVAEVVENEIDLLEEMAEENELSELNVLAEALREDLQQLTLPGTDVREALKKLSQMQQKMEALMADLKTSETDVQLQQLADALASADAFKPTASALEKGELQKAAKALEQVDASGIDNVESRTLSEKLAEAALEASENELDGLSESLQDLADSVRAANPAEIAKTSEQLAEDIQRHEMAKQMSQLLDSKAEQLGDLKKMFAGNSNSKGDGSASAARGLNLVKGESKRTQSVPSQKAGATAAGNINGQKTRLDGERQMARLNGQLGAEGETDIQTISTTENDAKAQRLATQTFAEYQKVSDAVLDSESIPVGHRQTIRRYFEMIRPKGSDQSGLPDSR